MENSMEKIIACNCSSQIKRIVQPMHIIWQEAEKKDAGQTLDALVRKRREEIPEGAQTAMPPESLLLFCDVSQKHLDKILFALRQKKISIDYKAVLTDTNRRWTLARLYMEMEREKKSLG